MTEEYREQIALNKSLAAERDEAKRLIDIQALGIREWSRKNGDLVFERDLLRERLATSETNRGALAAIVVEQKRALDLLRGIGGWNEWPTTAGVAL